VITAPMPSIVPRLDQLEPRQAGSGVCGSCGEARR
jgi:hypothetical protein